MNWTRTTDTAPGSEVTRSTTASGRGAMDPLSNVSPTIISSRSRL